MAQNFLGDCVFRFISKMTFIYKGLKIMSGTCGRLICIFVQNAWACIIWVQLQKFQYEHREWFVAGQVACLYQTRRWRRSLTHICAILPQCVNTLKQRQNGRHIAADTFKYIFMNSANTCINAVFGVASRFRDWRAPRYPRGDSSRFALFASIFP